VVKVDRGFMTGLAQTPALVRALEELGYDGLFSAETSHDPFIPLALAAEHTTRAEIGTSIAVAFARSPMTTAAMANDLHAYSGGRMVLGLGSQIKPHITRRFSMPWSQPAARMREYVHAMHAIWDSWNTQGKLDFRGDFYTHTLMTPFFMPEPNPHGPPKVFLAGVGELMTEVAGEVGDGFLCHAFTTERYLREVTLPALEKGRSKGGRPSFEIAITPFVATGRTEAELAAAVKGTKAQIAFYASTPAYRPVLELHGWGELQEELNRLSKQGEWERMGEIVPDEALAAFAVVAEPGQVASQLLDRFGDIADRLSLYLPYDDKDTDVAEIVAALRAGR
jgi:probable F420-dependent oxidoreductase